MLGYNWNPDGWILRKLPDIINIASYTYQDELLIVQKDLIITVLERTVKRSLTADEVDMQLSHPEVIAPHSAIDWPTQWNGEIRPGDLQVETAAVVCGGYICDMCAWCADPVSSSCCTTFRLLMLSRASSRTWMESFLRDLVSQQRTVPSMEPGNRQKTHRNQ